MKFLDAQRQENKMQPGSRKDQGGVDNDTLNQPAKTRTGPTNKMSQNNQVEELAKELGVDLSQVKGSGKDGKIMISDVHAAASKKDTDKIPLSTLRPPE